MIPAIDKFDLKWLVSQIKTSVLNSPRFMMGHSSFEAFNSSPREQMKYTQLGQVLVLMNPDRPSIFTGIEDQYGKGTLSIKAPCDMEVIRIISCGTGKNVSERTVIYRDLNAKLGTERYGRLKIPNISLKDKAYGFNYVPTRHASQLVPGGSMIAKGTVLYDSPAKDHDGRYCYGIQGRTALMTLPGTLQDGILISKSFAERSAFKEFGERRQSFGKKLIPLNLYGDSETYKIVPDTGEYTRQDGVLMAYREVDDLTAPILMTDKALREILPTDIKVYGVRGVSAKVINIKVRHNRNSRSPYLKPNMVQQLKYYIERRETYLNEIYKEELKIRRKPNATITPAFQKLSMQAYAERGRINGRDVLDGVNITRKADPIDEYELEVTVEAVKHLQNGNKLTNIAGGKGVVVDIIDDELMPMDRDGLRAEVVVNGDTFIKRMIMTGVMEMVINYTATEMLKICEKFHLAGKREDALNHYLTHFEYIAPWQHTSMLKYIKKGGDVYTMMLKDIRKKSCEHFMPIDNPVKYEFAIPAILKHSDVSIDHMTVYNEFGQADITHDKMFMANVYYVILEKTAGDWSAVSSASRNHVQQAGRITESQKYSHAVRPQPTRSIGETESRWLSAIMGARSTYTLLTLSSSTESHREMWKNLLNGKDMSLPNVAIDPKCIIMGRTSKIMHQVLECQGIGFARGGVRV